MDDASAGTWYELFARRALDTRVPWLIVPRTGAEEGAHDVISYATLFAEMRRVAAAFHARGIEQGERVLVLADNRAPSTTFMLAALALGVVVVPCSPLALGQSAERWRQALERVIEDCQPRLLVAHAPLATSLQGLSLAVCGVSELLSTAASAERAPRVSEHDLGIIQYTSGTTLQPRGVALTQQNLLHNVASIGRAIDVRAGDVGVSWLPTFHDMGLIGGLLFCAYWGMTLVLQRPVSFLTRPESWLRTIGRYRASCSPAPNSAYQLCATRCSEARLRGLDLSSWRVAFNGADLIHPRTLRAFTQRFAPHGFRAESMYPVYGLAENTLAATLPKRIELPRVDWVDTQRLVHDGAAVSLGEGPEARGVVCVGEALPDQQLCIVEPATGQLLADRQVGEIRLKGPSTASYWARGPRSQGTFTSDGWLCTGDRGYLVAGSLYAVGRIKHTVKHLGRTIDCGFVESTIASTRLAQTGAVAVFGEYDEARGSDKLVVVVETRRAASEQRALRADVCTAVREALSFAPDDVSFVPIGAIPRTTSGKVRHAEAHRLYQERLRAAASLP